MKTVLIKNVLFKMMLPGLAILFLSSCAQEKNAQTRQKNAPCDCDTKEKLVEKSQLSQEEIGKVVAYLVAQALPLDGTPKVSPKEIEKATGVSLGASDRTVIETAVSEALKDNPEALARLTKTTSRCEDYGACSLHGDLSSATGETLAMYEKEKAEDGKTFSQRNLPAFSAKSLQGNTVDSGQLKGKPTVLAFLAGHCSHSRDSLPILNELQTKYKAKGVNIVAVYINSGTVEDMNSWLPSFASPTFDIWVHEQATLGELFDSRLVPAYFLVNTNGLIQKKLVGFQSAENLQQQIDRFLQSS